MWFEHLSNGETLILVVFALFMFNGIFGAVVTICFTYVGTSVYTRQEMQSREDEIRGQVEVEKEKRRKLEIERMALNVSTPVPPTLSAPYPRVGYTSKVWSLRMSTMKMKTKPPQRTTARLQVHGVKQMGCRECHTYVTYLSKPALFYITHSEMSGDLPVTVCPASVLGTRHLCLLGSAATLRMTIDSNGLTSTSTVDGSI